MNARIAILSLLSTFVSVLAATAQSDCLLPLDEQVRTGRLPNGMHYYIRHNETPQERADFFIAHNVGALQEEDNENGLAHFLEHMAFNGTENFPKKGILEYLASIGVRFGYNVNAYTARERTVYNISNVPVTRESVVDSLLLILHDWSYYIACEPEEIEAERGVIREEWRRRDNSRSRMVFKTEQFEYEGSKYTRRDVIGDPHIIDTFEPQRLVDFYHRWYRPDMQAVIVVGDVDVDAVEQKILRTMGGIPAAVNPVPKEEYAIPRASGPRYGCISDPEAGAVGVKLIFRQPYPTPNERQQSRTLRQNLGRRIFLEMARVRLADSEKRPDSRYKRVVAVTGNLSTCRQTFQMTALPKNDNMHEALAGMLVEAERLRRYGFTDAEFERAKAKVAKAEQQAVEKSRRATNSELAAVYVEHFTRNEPYMTPDVREKAVDEALQSLTRADIEKLCRQMLSDEELIMLVSVPDRLADEVPTEEEAFALLDSVSNARIESPVSRSGDEKPLFDREVTAGKAIKSKKAAYDAVEWRLSNGARVFWRTVDDVAGRRKVSLLAVNEGGYSRNDDAAALRIVQNYLRSMGAGDFTHSELREKLALCDAGLSANLTREYSSLSGSSSIEDAETLFRLLNLYVTAPNFSEEEYGKFIELYRAQLEKETSPQQIYRDSSNIAMYGDHPWLKKTTVETLDRVDAAVARRLYDEQFGNAADYVFYLAGEMSAEEVLPLVEKYIGSLPSAPRAKFRRQNMKIVEGVRDYEYVHNGAPTPKSSISRYYHGKFKCTPHNCAVMRYLTYILNARYLATVREEKGGTYHIGVDNDVENRPKGYCRLSVTFETSPELVEMLLQEVQNGIEAIAQEAPSEQEIREARLYFMKVNAERGGQQRKTASYWIGKLKSRYGDGFDAMQDDERVFTSVDAEDVRRLAEKILRSGNRFTTVYTQR